jgi:hypothetical protein
MARSAALRWTDTFIDSAPSMADEIRAFLDGETNGEPLLHALDDHVLEEEIPARLLEALRG